MVRDRESSRKTAWKTGKTILFGERGWLLSQLLRVPVPGLSPIYRMRPWALIRTFQWFSVEAHLEPSQGGGAKARSSFSVVVFLPDHGGH